MRLSLVIEETECLCSGTRVHVANMSLVSCVMVFRDSCREILYLSHVYRVVSCKENRLEKQTIIESTAGVIDQSRVTASL